MDRSGVWQGARRSFENARSNSGGRVKGLGKTTTTGKAVGKMGGMGQRAGTCARRCHGVRFAERGGESGRLVR